MKYNIFKVIAQAVLSIVLSFFFTMIFFHQIDPSQQNEIFLSVAGLLFLVIAYTCNTKEKN